jgi:voltage-gated sodium channel
MHQFHIDGLDRSGMGPSQLVFLWLVQDKRVEGLLSLVILANMVVVIAETDATAAGGTKPAWFKVANNVLLTIYCTELATKLYALRRQFFQDKWNILDFVIVGTDVVFIFVGMLMSGGLPSVAPIRVFRLVRLVRAFKAAKFFKELHQLIRGFMNAVKAIFWGVLMIFMVLTIWGILAVNLIHPLNEQVVLNNESVYVGCERCHRAFDSVFNSVLTFFQTIVAGDSWGLLAAPIIEENPLSFVFFTGVLVTVNLVLLNLILSVIVESGMAAAAQDERERVMEQKKELSKAEARLIEMCSEIDSDGSGHITEKEFLLGYDAFPEFEQILQIMHVTRNDVHMIFMICDEDGSGDISYEEFVTQLRRIRQQSQHMILYYIAEIRHKM